MAIEAALSPDIFSAGDGMVLNVNLIEARITWETGLCACLWRITSILSVNIGRPILTMAKIVSSAGDSELSKMEKASWAPVCIH